MSTVARNEPCTCGSGRRYKDCHGRLGGSASTAAASPDPLNRAALLFRAGDADAAETLAREALIAQPGHPEALQIIGRCNNERGRLDEALRNLLDAAKALSNVALPPPRQLLVWSDLNSMFTEALSGVDGAFAAAKRADYAEWLASLSKREPGAAPLVSVVLVVRGEARWLEQALASVQGQSYRNLELVVADGSGGGETTRRLTELLSHCQLPYRLVALPAASEPALINAGVRSSTGEFATILDADHEFATVRIATLVERIATRGVAWGFSNVDFIDTDGRGSTQNEHPQVCRWRYLLDAVTEPDTLGYAFFRQECVAVAASNLFFSRAIFDSIGGMREVPHLHVWDFCLRAVWHEEPVYVAAPLYRYRVLSSPGVVPVAKSEFEAAQLTIFRDFYERAGDRNAVAPNRFAPCFYHWRLHFFKSPFHARHVLMFGMDRLEAIAEAILRQRPGQGGTKLAPGLNLIGFAFGEFGLGESLRAFASACALGGIPFIVMDVDVPLQARQADHSAVPHIADELRHRCSLFCLNPDMMKACRRLVAETAAAGAYTVGYWYWELEHLPREWDYALNGVDELWAATDFVASTMRRSTQKPVIKIPPPIELKLSRPYRRSEFGLPTDRFLFLFSFDFNSFAKRKNPDGLVAAFRLAFGAARRDVGLVIKSINGGKRPERLRALQDLIGDDDRITITDGFLNRDQVSGLESVVDAFVSLHRSEGLGLGLAESMYLGKPVIGTAYSGNLEFMNSENSCLVDYELVPVRKGEYLYDDSRFHWAEPDLDQAAYYMRRLADDADFRNRIAYQGQRDVRSRFTPAATAALLRRRLLELGLI
jgi:glycosyltransferase involved in cell wall biosynthesis